MLQPPAGGAALEAGSRARTWVKALIANWYFGVGVLGDWRRLDYSKIQVLSTLNYGINYVKGQEVKHLVRFSDSDHAGDMVGARSTSGMIFYLGRNAITWQSQKQQIISLSSCESEFIAATTIVTNSRYVVPTGRVKFPAGRYVVPTGKDNVTVSAGKSKVIPASRTILVLVVLCLLRVDSIVS
ncbi:hypothetical protein Tco_0363288 [Tanacetum coccineum]